MADYAISNVPRRVVYAPSGVGPYAFTFEILDQTDIAVYKASTLLTLTTDYTVTINANGTGSVTLVATAGTSNITIVGAKNIQRTTDFTTGGDLFANTLNDELDNQTIFIQQVAETAERGLKAPVVDPTDINMTLPAKASRVGTVLAFNATTGNPEAGPSIGSVTTVAAQSANINTVATNIASVNTVAGNITNVNTVAGVSGNVTTVASNIANVNAVGADLLEATSEINTVAVDIANVNTVGNNIASVNTVAGEIGAGQDVTVVAANLSGADTIGTVATNIANVNATGTNIANVNAVGADLLEAVSEINTVATDITNVNTVGTNIASVNTVAGVSGAVSTVAGISANVTTVAGVSSNVTTVAGISSNVTTVAGIAANVTTVANNSANVTIAATNVADINNFADVYQGAKATDPTLRNDGSALQSGDLYFNTTDDVMKVREAGAWLAAYASLSGALIAANNLSDVTSASTARTNLGLGTGNSPTFTTLNLSSNLTFTGTGNRIRGDFSNATTDNRVYFQSSTTNGITIVNAVPNGTAATAQFAIVNSSDTANSAFLAMSISTTDARLATNKTGTGTALPLVMFTNGSERLRIDTSGNVGIGTSSPLSVARATIKQPAFGTTQLHLEQSNATDGYGLKCDGSDGALAFSRYASGSYTERMRITSGGNVGVGTTSPYGIIDAVGTVYVSSAADNPQQLALYANSTASYVSSTYQGSGSYKPLAFEVAGSERMRIDTSGNFYIGKTSAALATTGFEFNVGTSAYSVFTNTRTDGDGNLVIINRQGSDGNLIAFAQASTVEGSITVSGTTVSYNGGHLSRWSQLPDGSKDETLLKGTVLTNLDDMCVWEKDGVVADNEQLNKMKVSDVEGDTNVAGVFVNWTVDEQYGVDDMNVAMTGDMIIRIADGVVVQKGDLLMSAGDGTAKPQGDDIVRSKTIAKVTSNYVTCTYADGSYCVPCVLMAC